RHTRCYRDWSSDVCSSDLGSIVTLRTTERPVTTRADENIVDQARRHGGVYDAQAHRDEVIRSGRLPAGVDPQEYVDRHLNRLEEIGRASWRERAERQGDEC